MTHDAPVAVITGDLIGSTRAPPAQVDAVLNDLKNTAWTGDQDLRFTRFRGDGWQVFLNDPRKSLSLVLLYHATLRAASQGLDSRFAIGIGTIASPGGKTLADGSGPAFEASGRALDGIGKRRLTLAGAGRTPQLDAILALSEHIIYGWTAPQAEAMALWLKTPDATQGDVAAHLGISRQAVQLRLSGAGKPAIASAITAFESMSFMQNHSDD